MAWWSRCVVLALLAGCTGWPPRPDAGSADAAIPTGCRLPFAGDPNLPPEMTLLVLGDRYVSQPLLDGGGLPLMFPPQGGRVAFAGLQARNVDAQARLSGLVRDLASGQIRLETRTVNLWVFDGVAQRGTSTLPPGPTFRCATTSGRPRMCTTIPLNWS